MSYGQTSGGEELAFYFGDAATPVENYTQSCTINTDRSYDFSANEATAEVRDCANPGAPAKVVRRIKSTDRKFSGAGTADPPSAYTLMQLAESGLAFDGKLILNRTGANGGWTKTGTWVVTGFKMGGAAGDFLTFSIDIAQADAPVTAKNA